jgi:hypothetical protein
VCCRDPVAYCGEIARPATLDAEPGAGSGDIRGRTQILPGLLAQFGIVNEQPDRVMARADHRRIGERCCQPPGQFACTRGRHRSINRCKQAALA